MDFRILGPLEVHVEGTPVALGGAKQRALLAILLLNANTVVASDRLIDEIWGADPPESAAKALQGYVSALRRALDPGRRRGAASEVLVTRPPGYAIHLQPEQLDLTRFERLREQARDAAAAGDPASARAALAAALSLWHGQALADLAYEPCAQAEIERLEELRLGALEERIEADLALGRHADVIAELEGLIDQHPLREQLRGQLMLALYRAGRQAEALQAYQHARGTLTDELGIEPSRDLRKLQQAILTQHPSLDLASPASEAEGDVFRVRLLGELTVEVDGQRVEIPTGRTRSLLAWLALHRGSHRRSDVAARFWPDILDTSARASLRTAIWALRKALGPAADDALIATRDRVGISAAPSVWSDVAAFEELVAEGRLREAVEIGQGELLADIDDDWVLEARSEHNDRLRDALGQLAAAAEASGETQAALELTGHQAALDPLDENAHRELIRRLIATGDRVRAITVYERLRERLRTELGLAPSPATGRLVASLKVETGRGHEGPVQAPSNGRDRRSPRRPQADRTTGRWEPGAPFPLPAPLAAERGGPFVGRAAQLERLRSTFADACEAGLPRFALISGEAGIGKTRLAAEIAAEICDRGAIALYGAAERKAVLAHPAFVEAVRHYVDTAAPGELRERVGSRARELARLIPEVAERIPVLGPPDESSSEAGMRQALDAAAALLVALAEEVPVLVIVDDLQWAEEPDLLLLRHLFTRRAGAGLLIVGVTREDELAGSGVLADAIADLARESHSQRLRLQGLEAREVETLCREWTGSDSLSATIHADSEGNPLFARQMVRHLEESEPESGRERLRVPLDARELISRRLAAVSTGCARTLEIAAVVGSQFDLAILERISGLDGDELAEVLEEAVRAGLVVEVSDAFERFRFAHALMGEALADGLTRTRRARIHARVAATLDALAEEGGGALLAARAHHWCEAGRAGDPEGAIGLATQAAEDASSRLAYGEALDLYNRALRLLPEGDQRRRGMLMSRAVAYQRLEHFLFVRVHGVSVSAAQSSAGNPT